MGGGECGSSVDGGGYESEDVAVEFGDGDVQIPGDVGGAGAVGAQGLKDAVEQG